MNPTPTATTTNAPTNSICASSHFQKPWNEKQALILRNSKDFGQSASRFLAVRNTIQGMELRIENNWTYIEGNYPKNLLDPVTSFLPKGYFFKPAYRKGFSDGRVRLVEWDPHLRKHRFPTGLLKLVVEHLDSQNWRYTLTDLREFEAAENSVVELLDSKIGKVYLDRGKYSYQGDAVQASLAAGRGVIRVGTGGGKTELGAAILASIDQQSVWLTHRENLLYQAHARLQERLGKKIGLLGDGVEDLQKITVAMVQTVNNVLKAPEKRPQAYQWLMNCRAMMGDEIHHVDGGSKSWYGSIMALPAIWRFGLSATPKFTGEGLYLLAVTGSVLYSVPSTELIRLGVLVPPRIWFATCDQPKLPKKTDWATLYSQAVVHNHFRNTKIAEIAKVFAAEKKSTLILVKRLNHGENVLDCLNFAGLRPGWIHGKIAREARDAILEDLWKGQLDAVVAVAETLGEGTDLPPLRAIINATATRGGGDASDDGSGRVTIQILGRGLRSYPGKTHCDYVDFFDKSHKFLTDASKDRVNTLESEGYGAFIRYWDQYGFDGGAATRTDSAA
jgi:superfamily II DNA or RNA helicase